MTTVLTSVRLVIFFCMHSFACCRNGARSLEARKTKHRCGHHKIWRLFLSLEGTFVCFSDFSVWSIFICKRKHVHLFLIRICCTPEVHVLMGTRLSNERKLGASAGNSYQPSLPQRSLSDDWYLTVFSI